MSTGMKFGFTAAVVIAVVALGYWMQKRKAQGDAPAKLKASTGAATGSKFATNADGTPDYTHNADGTPIWFTASTSPNRRVVVG